MRCIHCIPLVILTTILLSCIKKEDIGPQEEEVITTPIKNGVEFTDINGYFLASLSYYNKVNDNYNAAFFCSCFNDPAERLMKNYDRRTNSFDVVVSSNVSVGDVTFSNYELLQQQLSNKKLSYRLYTNQVYVQQPLWAIEGNGSFSAFNQTISRQFPVITIPANRRTVNPFKGFTFKFAGMFENCDSVAIEIFNYPNKAYKCVPRSADSITFFPQDVTFLQQIGAVQIYFWATNFSSQIIKNKKYVYELMVRDESVLDVDSL